VVIFVLLLVIFVAFSSSDNTIQELNIVCSSNRVLLNKLYFKLLPHADYHKKQ
jgi:hypothetical protein